MTSEAEEIDASTACRRRGGAKGDTWWKHPSAAIAPKGDSLACRKRSGAIKTARNLVIHSAVVRDKCGIRVARPV